MLAFDHDQFAELQQIKNAIILSHTIIGFYKTKFSKWNAAEFAHTYTMRSSGSYSDQSKEWFLSF